MMKRMLILCALMLTACNDTTGGHLIAVPFAVGGVARDTTQPFTFTTNSSWTVTLDKAVAVLGPFYFNIQPPDPDFFRSGVVIMQATEQVVIDALDPTLQNVPGGADGETGHAVAVEIDLFTTTYQYNQLITLTPPLLGPGSGSSAEHGAAYVSGHATKGGVVVAFAGRIVIDANALTSSIPIEAAACVPGSVCDLSFAANTKALSLRVDPSHWFDDQPEFCQLVPAAAGATCNPDSTQVYGWSSASGFNAALVTGLKSSTAAYTFAIETK